MSDTLQDLARYVQTAATELAAAVQEGDHERAKASAREVLSAGSKVHQRLGILVEIDREARWMASVDRAARAAKPEVPGQLSIQDAIAKVSKARKPRKPKPPAE